MITINELEIQAHDNAVNHGFYDEPKDLPHRLMLIVDEVCEALRADRIGDDDNFAEELADIVIRTADLAGWLDIDLEAEIVAKMKKNSERPRLHNKKY